MDIRALIETKKLCGTLQPEQIGEFVRAYTASEVPEYQAAALLMAIRLNGMDDAETRALTLAMAESGDVLDLSNVRGITVDKHSTGGVSDSTTLVIVPILAELGYKVAKMSGRALGHTGGTIDKLETFGDYRTELSQEEFLQIVDTVGASVIGSSRTFAPADKRLYALRDVTATVDSMPLIAASVLSKKLAAGAQVLVFDVKYGDGAFMRTRESAVELAELMVRIARDCGRRAGAIVSGMQQPLGNRIGAGEATEAMSVLRGESFESDFWKVSEALVHAISAAAGNPVPRERIREVVADGRAYARWERIVRAHGGSVPPPVGPLPHAVDAMSGGYVRRIRTRRLGEILAESAGRHKLGDGVDHNAGIDLCVRLGDRVARGDRLAATTLRERVSEIADCFEIGERAEDVPPLIAKIIL